MKYTSSYVPPILTVDAVMFQITNGVLEVLLLKRPNEPFKGEWALPGGYNAKGETTTGALHRVVLQKTGVNTEKEVRYIEQLYTFDNVNRDPRGHAVSVTYMGCGKDIMLRHAGAHVAFLDANHLPPLAYDHAAIIQYARKRLISKLTYTNIATVFLDEHFTLTQLQSVYEIIIGREFDKRNFRKKILKQHFIHEANDLWRDGAHRPAKLYECNSKTLQQLEQNFG